MNYNYDMYGTGYTDSSSLGLLAGMGVIIWIVSLAISIFSIVVMWKVFKKAGKPGWASIVPVYNLYVLFEITWGKGWLFLTMFASIIPVIGTIAVAVIIIITYVKLAKSFGKSGGFAVGLIFLNMIFMAILAFGKNEYVGPITKNNQTEAPSQQPMPQPVNNMPNMQMGPQMTPPMNQTNIENSNPLQMPMPTDTTINQIQTQSEPTVAPMPQPMNNPQPVPPQMINTQEQPVTPGATNGAVCPHCNASISENVLFCPTCGKPVK